MAPTARPRWERNGDTPAARTTSLERTYRQAQAQRNAALGQLNEALRVLGPEAMLRIVTTMTSATPPPPYSPRRGAEPAPRPRTDTQVAPRPATRPRTDTQVAPRPAIRTHREPIYISEDSDGGEAGDEPEPRTEHQLDHPMCRHTAVNIARNALIDYAPTACHFQEELDRFGRRRCLECREFYRPCSAVPSEAIPLVNRAMKLVDEFLEKPYDEDLTERMEQLHLSLQIELGEGPFDPVEARRQVSSAKQLRTERNVARQRVAHLKKRVRHFESLVEKLQRAQRGEE